MNSPVPTEKAGKSHVRVHTLIWMPGWIGPFVDTSRSVGWASLFVSHARLPWLSWRLDALALAEVSLKEGKASWGPQTLHQDSVSAEEEKPQVPDSYKGSASRQRHHN